MKVIAFVKNIIYLKGRTFGGKKIWQIWQKFAKLNSAKFMVYLLSVKFSDFSLSAKLKSAKFTYYEIVCPTNRIVSKDFVNLREDKDDSEWNEEDIDFERNIF